MFTVRRAESTDVEALVSLRLALLRDTGHIKAGVTDAELASLVEAHRRYFKRSIATEKFIAFVAVSDGTVVGSGGLVFVDRPPYMGNLAGRDAYLMNMYTAPDFRQKGVGSRILALLLAFAKEAGAKRVWLHSDPEARKLYERAGFVPKTSEMEMLL